MTKIKLKPCPFCGSTYLVQYGMKAGGGVQGYIECCSCGCQLHSFLCETSEEAKQEAANKWNTRADGGADDGKSISM